MKNFEKIIRDITYLCMLCSNRHRSGPKERPKVCVILFLELYNSVALE
jgi:hypothetical protein